MERTLKGTIAWIPPGIAFLAIIAFISVPLTVRAQENPTTITIALNEYEGSGVSGWATLTAEDEGVGVQMAVQGDAVTGDHPTHIHTGTCDNFDPSPTFPLNTVILDPLSSDGVSQSNVPDTTLDELLADEHVILIHKSMDELTTYFVCGDINQANAIPAPAAGSAGSVEMGDVGTGSSVAGSGSSLTLIVSAFAAMILGTIAYWLRRISLRA